MISRAVFGFVVASIAVFAAPPQWGRWAGPTRIFHAPARPIVETWREGGPHVVWKRPMPFGSSSVLVDGNRLYTMYRDGDNEVVVALEADTGRTVWEYKYPAVFLKGMNMNTGPGPHATALLAGDQLYPAGVN